MDLQQQLAIEQLQHKNIHVIGVSGAEGTAIVEFLWQHGIRSITAHDFVHQPDFAKSFRLYHLSLSPLERKKKLDFILSLPMTIHYQDTYLENIEHAEVVFASCGWFKHAANFPKLKKIYDKKIPFYNTIQLYLLYCRGTSIAVTGTNGKSTTSALIAHILKTAGKTAYLAGNAREGQQVLDKIETMNKNDFLVLEVSDRQLLEDIPKGPHIAVITNISKNHLDDHASMEDYTAVKKRLFQYQTKNDVAIINYDDEVTREFANEFASKKFIFTSQNVLPSTHNGSYQKQGNMYLNLHGKEEEICSFSDIQTPGLHNRSNAQAASIATHLVGLTTKQIRQGIQTFTGLKNRLQLVATIHGIRFYDDIQSTTPVSTEKALESFQKPVILIAGGDDKGMDYERLGHLIDEKVKTLILLPGSGTEKIKSKVKSQKLKIVAASQDSQRSKFNIIKTRAFQQTLQEVKKIAVEGDIVLVSPACAGFQSHYLKGKSIKTWVEESF